MTSNRDKKEHILNKSKKKKKKRIKTEQGMWTIWDDTAEEGKR